MVRFRWVNLGLPLTDYHCRHSTELRVHRLRHRNSISTGRVRSLARSGLVTRQSGLPMVCLIHRMLGAPLRSSQDIHLLSVYSRKDSAILELGWRLQRDYRRTSRTGSAARASCSLSHSAVFWLHVYQCANAERRQLQVCAFCPSSMRTHLTCL